MKKMMTEKFTPGPWYMDRGGDIIRADGTELLRRSEPVFGVPLDETFANATLAHAAPDMYEALAELVESIELSVEDPYSTWVGEAMDKARAALKKAVPDD